MKEWAVIALIVGCMLFTLASCVMTIGVWSECRATNSFFYCVHLISK